MLKTNTEERLELERQSMGSKIEYALGQKIPNTLLSFIREVPKKTKGRRRAIFLCECGNFTESNIVHVTNGNTQSCGCLHSENAAKRLRTHGQARRSGRTREYETWLSMHYRVKTARWYVDINVCERWNKFENFFADMGERPEGHTIERIDGTKDYCPENCVWATPKAQANNTSSNIKVTVNGVTKTVAEWCDITGLNPYTVYTRIHTGMPPEEAVIKPLMRTNGKPK